MKQIVHLSARDSQSANKSPIRWTIASCQVRGIRVFPTFFPEHRDRESCTKRISTREISRSKFPLPSIINNRKLRLVEIPDLFSSRECFSSPIFSLAVVDLSAPSWERTDGKVWDWNWKWLLIRGGEVDLLFATWRYFVSSIASTRWKSEEGDGNRNGWKSSNIACMNIVNEIS